MARHHVWKPGIATDRERPRHMIRRTALLAVLLTGCEEETIAPDAPPPNRPPVVSAAILDQRLSGPGEATTLEVSGHFSDPDGNELTYAAASSDTVGCDDLDGGKHSDADGWERGRGGTSDRDGPRSGRGGGVGDVRGGGEPSSGVVSDSVPAQTLWHGATRVDVDLTGAFADPDGDSLTYAVTSSDTTIVPVALHPGPMVSLAGPLQGEVIVTITARDPEGLEAQATFSVAVTENPDRAALEALYHATDGPNWADNWVTDTSLEDWYAIGLDERGRVSCLGSCRLPNGAWERLRLCSIDHLPPELGNLDALETLALTRLGPQYAGCGAGESSGPIPPELESLEALKVLYLTNLGLSGHIPPEWIALKALEQLSLAGNHLAGPVPSWLQDLPMLEHVRLTSVVKHIPGSPKWRRDNSDLCASASMRSWQEDKWGEKYLKPGGGIRPCDEDGSVGAYLIQAVQSRESPVPLIADKNALLRVFTLSPPFQARFYLDGRKTHDVEVARSAFAVAGHMGASVGGAIHQSDLAGATWIPGFVIRPGLEMVIENEQGRIPAEGRLAVDVREFPVFNLTIVPLLKKYGDDPRLDSIFAGDTAYIARADSMAADPERGNWRLWHAADLLPVGAMSVMAHEPVEYDPRNTGGSSVPGGSGLLAVRTVRALEGGTGYWMGLGSMFGGGVAYFRGWVSMTGGAGPATIAHEIGHNLGLYHTPTSAFASFVDTNYPHPDGHIGAWGFAHRQLPRRGKEPIPAQRLVSPTTSDIMHWLGGTWISESGLAVHLAASSRPVQSLLLWGGADSETGAYLEPVFVVDAPPSLPEQSGPWTIKGRDASGRTLFSLPFAMPEIADAGEGAGSFAYTLPVRSGWETLASITLSGPGGTATLDESTDRPMSIYRDEDGKVRAILHGDPVQAYGATSGLADVPLHVVTSRGIPSLDAWRR